MFYMLSFAQGHYETGNHDDYRTVSNDIKTVQGVHDAVEQDKKVNGLDAEYDYMYSVADCEYDRECEGGFSILGSMAYEEWMQENPDMDRG